MTRAFTFIEILVIVAILAIIGALVFGILKGKHYVKDGAYIKVIGGCEYIATGTYDCQILQHKENCTNSFHSWNQ